MSTYPSVKVRRITRNIVDWSLDITLSAWRDPGRRPNMDKMLKVALGPVHRSVNRDLRVTISQNVDAAESAFYIIKHWANQANHRCIQYHHPRQTRRRMTLFFPNLLPKNLEFRSSKSRITKTSIFLVVFFLHNFSSQPSSSLLFAP